MKLLALLILTLPIIGDSAPKTKATKRYTGTYFDLTCLRFCTINYYPVCATNGQCVFEFKNKCKMNNNNCELAKENKTEFKPVSHRNCFRQNKHKFCRLEDIPLKRKTNTTITKTPKLKFKGPQIRKPTSLGGETFIARR